MSHIAIAQSFRGNVAQWLEQVSEAQYRAESAKPLTIARELFSKAQAST